MFECPLTALQYHINNKNVGNQESMEDWRSMNLAPPDLIYMDKLTARAVRGINPLTPPDLLQHEIPQVQPPQRISPPTQRAHNV